MIRLTSRSYQTRRTDRHAVAVAALLSAPICGAVGKRRFSLPFLPSLLAPLGLPVLGWAVLRSAYRGWRQGGIVWRGTLYDLDSLRRGRRISLLGPVRPVRRQGRGV
ncbi:MAG: hypothetical protein ACE5IK_08925 [Acidobacteriota bacterium]